MVSCTEVVVYRLEINPAVLRSKKNILHLKVIIVCSALHCPVDICMQQEGPWETQLSGSMRPRCVHLALSGTRLEMAYVHYIVQVIHPVLWLLVWDSTPITAVEDRIGRRLPPSKRLMCALEAGMLSHVADAGHLWGHMQRHSWSALCLRLDWFLGTLPQGPKSAVYVANSFACMLSLVLAALLALS